MRPLRFALLALALVASSATAGRAAAQAAASSPARDVPLTGAERARYVGHFTLRDAAGAGATPLRVYEDAGVLLGQLRANTPSRLVHEGRNVFHPADAADFRLTFTLAGAHATRVEMRGPGMTMAGDRDGDASVGAPVDSSVAGPLFDTVARLDSLIFDASYVRCDTARVYALLTDDVEFYHDVTGVHRGAQVRADFARLAASCPAGQGIRRELVPGSLRVYRVSDFGAVETGTHRFVPRGGAAATTARFVHVWQRDGDRWRATRILSLDHHLTP